jgi:hypothetical protein
MFGGQRTGGGPGIMSVEEYDPATDSWRSRADMPTARLGMTAGVVNDKCYVIGGATEPGGEGLNRVDEYDPVTNDWRRRADMPTTRVVGASAVMDGRIYVAGGWPDTDISGAALASLEIYDPSSNTWASGADMPTARAILAASVAAEELFFIGGGSSALGTRDTSLVESYDPMTDTWTRRADMPTPRGALTATSVGGLVYAIGGGFDVQQLATVEVYDALADAWSERTSMPTARWGVASGVTGGKIYVLGGSTEKGIGHNSVSSNEAYTAESFSVNAAISDAWFFPDTAGQGFFIIVWEDSKLVFLAWFTYDTERPPEDVMAILGEPGHRWLTALGPFEGDTALLDVFLSSGMVFDLAAPPVTTEQLEGATIEIVWTDCKKGLVTYNIPSLVLMGEIPIERIVEDKVAACEAAQAQ